MHRVISGSDRCRQVCGGGASVTGRAHRSAQAGSSGQAGAAGRGRAGPGLRAGGLSLAECHCALREEGA